MEKMLNTQKPEKKSTFVNINLRQYTMIIALVVIWVALTFLTDGAFLSARNLSNLIRAMSVTAILAIGMFMILVAGHIDLSVGSVCGLTGGIAAILQVWKGWNTVSAIGVALLLGVAIGLWNGYWVAYKRVPAFIVTLGGLMAFRGVLMGVTKGITVAPLKKSFAAIGQAYVPYVAGWIICVIAILVVIYLSLRRRNSRIKYGFEVNSMNVEIVKIVFYCVLILAFSFVMNVYKGIPVPVFIVLALAILFAFITTKTQFGRQVFAMGGNVEAARLSGINVRKRTLTIFVLSSVLASLAGVVLTARLNAATISAGQMYELDAVASCVIGGTSLMGGEGSIVGAMIGALVMASLDNGMSLLNTMPFWQYIVKGLILVLAVWIDIETKKKKA
jgi:D-xylose transport system permease protein